MVVKVHKPFENLGNVNSNEVLGEFAKPLADIVEGAVLAVSGRSSDGKLAMGC